MIRRGFLWTKVDWEQHRKRASLMNASLKTRSLEIGMKTRRQIYARTSHPVPGLVSSLKTLLDRGSGVRVSLSGEESLLKPAYMHNMRN